MYVVDLNRPDGNNAKRYNGRNTHTFPTDIMMCVMHNWSGHKRKHGGGVVRYGVMFREWIVNEGRLIGLRYGSQLLLFLIFFILYLRSRNEWLVATRLIREKTKKFWWFQLNINEYRKVWPSFVLTVKVSLYIVSYLAIRFSGGGGGGLDLETK